MKSDCRARFWRTLGKRYLSILREERLRIAQTLLSSTPLSIASIAEEIGFSSAANFRHGISRAIPCDSIDVSRRASRQRRG